MVAGVAVRTAIPEIPEVQAEQVLMVLRATLAHLAQALHRAGRVAPETQVQTEMQAPQALRVQVLRQVIPETPEVLVLTVLQGLLVIPETPELLATPEMLRPLLL